MYGNNAFFGVVNVITKKAQYIEGAEAATHFASHNARSGRLTYGHVLENGMGLTLSVSGARNQGEDLFFPEFNGSAINGNYDK